MIFNFTIFLIFQIWYLLFWLQLIFSLFIYIYIYIYNFILLGFFSIKFDTYFFISIFFALTSFLNWYFFHDFIFQN
jgi:hypothetical protein